ncbi:hypothetical protein L228DRAFT_235905 [Xylona heveae TC161]|uniref:SWIM-type domain-containing protein n=1 Tax=Xylona heveae (strain CBS 132557 / TC161) TaxID=1328760 RepID=A0A165K223_XYLHT|nr:hypothetical protein L228DRAFT_235905 [Xylona heveae TC161]KZF26899.1 hypothetical protein L228DRAFT_235905 [Xylona heveae TC161]
MSDPIEQFQNLRLQGTMPTTRSQGRAAAGGEDVQTVQGESGITYDSRDLSPASWQRAVQGIQGEFDVSFCAKHNDYYAFEIAENGRASVRVWDNRRTCSCGDFQTQRGPAACKHIFWLIEQLNSVSSDEVSSPVSLNRDGQASGQAKMFERIALEGLEYIAEEMDWPLEREQVVAVPDRKRVLRDMLSVFDRNSTLPEDYRQDMVDAVPDTGFDDDDDEETFVKNDFEATIFRLAIEDDVFFSRLRKLINAELCAQAYISKIQANARKSLDALDRFVTQGPAATANDRAPRLNVIQCAASLKRLVASLQNDLRARAPVTESTNSFAAKLLVWILDQVSDRNKDAYARVQWARQAPAGENAADRNLFLRLIAGGTDESNFFILQILPDFADVLRDYTEQLAKVADKLRRSGAPTAFVRALDNVLSIIPKRKRTTSGARRGNEKRMK